MAKKVAKEENNKSNNDAKEENNKSNNDMEFNQLDNVVEQSADSNQKTEDISAKNQSDDNLSTEGNKVSQEELEALEVAEATSKDGFDGPVYIEDPDEPAPNSLVSHICALCSNFPCKDQNLNTKSFQPFHSSQLKNNYKVPLCRSKANFLSNYEPISMTYQHNIPSVNNSEIEEMKRLAEIERDRAQQLLEDAKQKLTIVMARLETCTRKFSANTPEFANALRSAITDSLRTIQRNIIPEYQFDNA